MKPAPNSTPPASLSARLRLLQDTIQNARAGRGPRSQPVTLIGASKTQPPEIVAQAIRLGMTDFGENKVQEAQAKWPPLKTAHPHIRLHLIGPLQSNKAAEAVALFDVIQTVDREKIATALAGEMKKQHRTPTCYIQVNTGEEPQKGGVAPSALAALLDHCKTVGLPVSGLMCIPPAQMNPAPHFALLKQLADQHGLTELSMGMSDDFADAIRLGATAVRIGTKLFGARQT